MKNSPYFLITVGASNFPFFLLNCLSLKLPEEYIQEDVLNTSHFVIIHRHFKVVCSNLIDDINRNLN